VWIWLARGDDDQADLPDVWVSRQALSRAMERADRGFRCKHWNRKRPGKKPRPVEQVEMEQLAASKSDLEKETGALEAEVRGGQDVPGVAEEVGAGEMLPGRRLLRGEKGGSRHTDKKTG